MEIKPSDEISPSIKIVRLLNFYKKNIAIKNINFLQKQNSMK